MTRYLLDTSIIGNVIEPLPSESFLAWWAERRDEDLFIASLTVAEIRRGILETPPGRRRDALDHWFGGAEGPQALFAGRILPFNDKAGLIWARVDGGGTQRGASAQRAGHDHRGVAGLDGCVVVTDNEKDFAGVGFVNPIRGGWGDGEVGGGGSREVGGRVGVAGEVGRHGV